MIKTISLFPGITLRCHRDSRFKQGCLSLQFLRKMSAEESAQNALLCNVLLRGCRQHPNLRAITQAQDDLYGAGISPLIRRIGDYQCIGFYCGFMDERFSLAGDRILEPLLELVGQLLLEPVTEEGVFSAEFVESEKKNLISTIESEWNDKRAYAAAQLLRGMCSKDSFGVPRLGTAEAVKKIHAASLYDHYQRVLQESPVELFYVGAAEPEQVASLLKDLFAKIDRSYVNLPAQTPFCDGGEFHGEEAKEVNQAKLCMGFVTPITNKSKEFAAMQVCNALFGGGQTSKLFMNVREKLSLCYSVSSGYFGSKGILSVSAGIDTGSREQTQQEILHQLDACRQGDFTSEELQCAKEALISGLRSVHDSPGAIEGYYSTAAISGLGMTADAYIGAIEAVTAEQVAAAAGTISLHSTYFLKEATV